MSKIIIVKPAPGRRVLDPASDPPKVLPPGGRRVVEDAYWLRRLKAGEVSMAEVADAPGDAAATDLPETLQEPCPAPESGRKGKKGKEKE